jgi:murein DD-endopeptidase MepM/ murein hydrolase activator NlpD
VSGRHHRGRTGRHRAPHHPRGRTVALSTTLGAALLTGVAGTAAASGDERPAAPPSAEGPLAGLDRPTITPAAGPLAELENLAGGLRTGLEQLSMTGLASRWAAAPAATVRHKDRPAAAWVHPNPTGTVTSCFGPRWGREHQGVDLAAPNGAPIVAAGAGVVVRAGEEGGYGNAVLIDHGDGYLTHYGHMSAITVTVGQRVTPGQPIGVEGSTGHSTGPHLHFEVHQGFYQNPVEPTLWLHARGVDIPGCGTY